MIPSKGVIESLGGSDPSEPPEGDMLEQHLSAFKRALDGGNMKQAASCFRAALDEAGGEQETEAGANEGDETEY